MTTAYSLCLCRALVLKKGTSRPVPTNCSSGEAFEDCFAFLSRHMEDPDLMWALSLDARAKKIVFLPETTFDVPISVHHN